MLSNARFIPVSRTRAGPGFEGSGCKQNTEKLRQFHHGLFYFFFPFTRKLLHAAILEGSRVVV